MSTSSFSWRCPSCGRQVPRKIVACRCGSNRPAEPSHAIVATRDPAPEPVTRGTNPLLIGLFLGLAIAAGMLWWLKDAPAAQPVEPAARTPRVATPHIAEPESDVPAPDTDVAITAENSFADVDLAIPVAGVTSSALEDVVARTLPAVASIQAGRGRGTGFFVQRDTVITNQHVVGNETSVQLTVGGKRYSARVTRTSPSTDLAVLQVYGPDPAQPTLRLGSTQGLRAGQEVVAIGSALGVLSNTVTRGIVSAVRDTGSVTLVQTDAAINPGNSGGPLVDRGGVVIGVNSMKIGGAQGEGLAFAVAIDHAAQLLSGQTAAAAATPLQGLNQIMTGATASENLRDDGTAAYQAVVERTARRSDQLDEYWERGASSCVARAAGGGDRAWFSVYPRNGIEIHLSSGINCESWLSTLTENAHLVRGEMVKAADAARRQGVYPGVMRDIRRRFRMDGPGW